MKADRPAWQRRAAAHGKAAEFFALGAAAIGVGVREFRRRVTAVDLDDPTRKEPDR